MHAYTAMELIIRPGMNKEILQFLLEPLVQIHNCVVLFQSLNEYCQLAKLRIYC